MVVEVRKRMEDGRMDDDRYSKIEWWLEVKERGKELTHRLDVFAFWRGFARCRARHCCYVCLIRRTVYD